MVPSNIFRLEQAQQLRRPTFYLPYYWDVILNRNPHFCTTIDTGSTPVVPPVLIGISENFFGSITYALIILSSRL